MAKIGSRSLHKSLSSERQIPMKENALYSPIESNSLEERTLKAVYPHFPRASTRESSMINVSREDFKFTKEHEAMRDAASRFHKAYKKVKNK